MAGPARHEEMSESGTFQHRSRTLLGSSNMPHRQGLHQSIGSARPPLSHQSEEFNPPSWPLAATGRSDSQTLVESSQDPHADLRSWPTPLPTPVDSSASTKCFPLVYTNPPTPMNQSHISLAALLPPGPAKLPGKAESDSGDSILVLNERDDAASWGGWRRHVFRLVPFLTFANIGIYLTYMSLRIACVIWAQEANDALYEAAWIFIAVELAVAVPCLMHNTWTMWSMKKRNRNQLRLKGFDVPTVDVFVTCCGEDDHVVLDTVRAACDLDYPADRFRVIILDDGRSTNLEVNISNLALSYPNLFYMAREKYGGQPHHFKAGNLNFGLEQANLLPGGAGQFMAALDADMIPEPHWLRAVLPHLLTDPAMGLACPPQLFYNTPASDPLAQSLDFFVHVIEPIKDALGVAWCTGSGYVARREALDDIGNFPLGSLAEDVATSTLMLGKGWKTAYVHEPLQFGTVPEDFGSHLKQRTRWAVGTVDTACKLKFCLWGEKVRRMTFAQRFSGFLYASLSLYTILLTTSLFAIPIILIMGKPLVAFATEDQLRWLIRACFAAVVTNRLCEFVLFIPAGYHTGQRGSRYQIWISPYIALCLIRSFVLPRWLGGQVQAFQPTGSLCSLLKERDPLRKKSLLRRLWAILFNFMAAFHFAFVYFTLVAVVLTSYRCFVLENGGGIRDVMICLITHAFWPPLTFIFICSSLWTPIAYAIDPPMMPEREQLLDRDPKTSVAHPTPKSKRIAFGGQAAWFEFELSASTIYTAVVFVASFIL